jgi:hypothetical protein
LRLSESLRSSTTLKVNLLSQLISPVVRLQTLALLSAEFFSEIKPKYLKEELCKFEFPNLLEQMFGREAGKLLFKEADSEGSFVTENVLQLVMEPLDSEDFTAEQRLKAKSNCRNINNQVTRLVRIFETK